MIALVLHRVHWIIYGESHLGGSRICVEHHALPGHAALGKSHSPIGRHSNYHLWIQR